MSIYKYRPEVPWDYLANQAVSWRYVPPNSPKNINVMEPKPSALAAVMEEAAKLPPMCEQKSTGGRPKKDVTAKELWDWINMGHSRAETAKKFSISVSTLRNRIRKG